jgi:8-oxo-dGTP pyrophosphatase MutT (NUDIX family)
MKDLNPRDGSFVVIYSGSQNKLEDMEFFLGCSINDSLYELLGGGFDLSDITPDFAALREVSEETKNKLLIPKNELKYFSHMIQKLPKLGVGEKGSVFCFFYECDKNYFLNLESSDEHSLLVWHKFSDLTKEGEKLFRTSTIRIIFHFLNYLSTKEFRFGILGDKIKFMNYEF